MFVFVQIHQQINKSAHVHNTTIACWITGPKPRANSAHYTTGTTSANLDAVENGEAPIGSTVPSAPPVNAESAATSVDSGGNQHPSIGGKEGGEKEDAEVNANGKEKKKEPGTAGIGQIFFKYATALELIYMFLGTCFAVLTG